MDTKYFALGNIEKNRLVRIARLLFGILCIAVALYWVIFNINSAKSYGTVWITIIFLTGFGFYQVMTGLGKAERYIEIGKEAIVLKRNAFLSPLDIPASKTEKIEFFPLKVVFCMESGKKILFRLGTTWYEANEKITEEISRYAYENDISTEIIEEEI